MFVLHLVYMFLFSLGNIYFAEQVNTCSVWSFFFLICRKYLVLRPTTPELLASYVLNFVCLCELNIAQSLQVPWDTSFFKGRAVGEVVQGTACPCSPAQLLVRCDMGRCAGAVGMGICEQQETGPRVWMCLCMGRDEEMQ